MLDATRNLYNAKRQQAEAGYNFVLDGLKLKQAAGTLNAADIAAISQQRSCSPAWRHEQQGHPGGMAISI